MRKKAAISDCIAERRPRERHDKKVVIVAHSMGSSVSPLAECTNKREGKTENLRILGYAGRHFESNFVT